MKSLQRSMGVAMFFNDDEGADNTETELGLGKQIYVLWQKWKMSAVLHCAMFFSLAVSCRTREIQQLPSSVTPPCSFPIAWAIKYLTIPALDNKDSLFWKGPEARKIYIPNASILNGDTLVKSFWASTGMCLPLWARDKPPNSWDLIRSHPGRQEQTAENYLLWIH